MVNKEWSFVTKILTQYTCLYSGEASTNVCTCHLRIQIITENKVVLLPKEVFQEFYQSIRVKSVQSWTYIQSRDWLKTTYISKIACTKRVSSERYRVVKDYTHLWENACNYFVLCFQNICKSKHILILYAIQVHPKCFDNMYI